MKNNHLRHVVLLLFFVVASFALAQTDSTSAVSLADTTVAAVDVTPEAAPEVVAATEVPAQPAAKKAKQKYTGPMPCAAVNTHNGSLVPVGTYVLINKYFNVSKDELLSGSDVIDFASPGVKRFAYQEVQNAFRTGIIKHVDVRLITSYFIKSMDRLKPNGDVFSDENSGFGDFKLIGRYGIMNQKTGPANIIVGIGTTIPVGTTDAVDVNGNVLPGSMQLSSGSFNPIFELGAHQIKKRNWNNVYFVYVMATDGELGPHVFKRSSVFKYNYTYAYAAHMKLDVGFELNGEVKTKAVKNGVDIENTGGHVIYVAPEAHIKFSKKIHLGVCMPIAVYQDLNGPQLGGGSMIITKFDIKF
ncbi:MAG: hypothetical protein U9Q77_03985 [Candidatus Marinimicrobia bacterium]|nr:hypothetical protein [Candidatus Neomarinimicrobiota bacterium]